MLLGRIDDLGKPAWLALLVGAFWAAWPLGLVLLTFLVTSGRLRGLRREMANLPGRWFNMDGGAGNGRGVWNWPPSHAAGSSGNEAFDAYRDAELSRLEREQQEFKGFLDRLRKARDKAEFDQFMAERRRRTDVSASDTRPDPS